jgi:hypothetical protein
LRSGRNLALVKERFLGDSQLVDEIVKDIATWKNLRITTVELLRAGKIKEAIAWHKEQSREIIREIEKNMHDIS